MDPPSAAELGGPAGLRAGRSPPLSATATLS
jgi:hypothetical protein